MNRTKIEWAKNPDGTPGYTWNPITGCLNHDNGICKGGGFPCYAYKLANGRVKQRYIRNFEIALPHENPRIAFNDPFYPRFWPERLPALHEGMKNKGIFVCDMSDLFGIGIPEEWTEKVIDWIKACDWHRFYLLTKQSQNLPKWSPFPENCWVGVTATNHQMYLGSVNNLRDIDAKVRYLSLEPLLHRIDVSYDMFDWIIIGACTGTGYEMKWLIRNYTSLTLMPWGKKWTAQPRIEWVKEIVEAADAAGVKVFLKDNLKPLLWSEDERILVPDWARMYGEYDGIGGFEYRQEMPE